MIDNEKIKAIIKQYADKDKKMYSEAINSRDSRYNAGFWDGYECCAKGLLRELKDMQEEPTIPDIVDEHFYEMLGEESISDELDTAAKESSRIERSDDTEVGYDLSKYNGFVEGALWKEQQIKKNAVDAVVKIDAGGYPYVDRTIELYDYDKDIPLAKRGDKVKILVIKE